MRAIFAFLTAAVGISLVTLPAGVLAADREPFKNVDQVLQCMRANMVPGIWSTRIELTARDVGGLERHLHGKLHAQLTDDTSNVTIRLSDPSDLAGASYLLRRQGGNNDIYVYLPAVQKPKRLTAAALDGSIFGTDMSFNEIALLTTAFNLAWLDLPGLHEGRRVYRVNIWPQAGLSTRYKQVRMLVDQSSCVALRFDLMDAKGSQKLMLVDGKKLQQIGGRWLPSVVEVQNLDNGTVTQLRFLDTKKLERAPARVFDPNGFWEAPITRK